MPKYENYDEYIEASAEFAQPILSLIRSYVNEACPEAKEEFKWGFPNFTYQGNILCSMASFKAHIAFTFWLGNSMNDPEGILNPVGKTGMGSLGKITALEQLPSKDIFLKYLKHAVELTEQNTPRQTKSSTKAKHDFPEILREALDSAPEAQKHFDEMSNSHQYEYVEWIAEAKTDTTKQKRLKQSIEWISEGKPRNWKYMKKYKS